MQTYCGRWNSCLEHLALHYSGVKWNGSRASRAQRWKYWRCLAHNRHTWTGHRISAVYRLVVCRWQTFWSTCSPLFHYHIHRRACFRSVSCLYCDSEEIGYYDAVLAVNMYSQLINELRNITKTKTFRWSGYWHYIQLYSPRMIAELSINIKIRHTTTNIK